MRRIAPLLLLASIAWSPVTTSLAATSAADPAATPVRERTRYDGDKVVRAAIRSSRDLRTMLALSDDMWSHGVRNGIADFRVSAEALRALAATDIPFEVLIDDVQSAIDAEHDRLAAAQGGIAGADWFDDFKDNAAIAAYVDELVALRPDLCTPIVLGQSLENRPIRGLRIAAGPGKPAVLFNACQHAREWISPMVVMYLADHLVRHADDDPAVADLLSRVEFIVVPVVNPDGYQFSWDDTRLWRKNRRNNGDGSFGVDLNRNWDYQWGGEGSSGNPTSETYRGPSAFSEPETQAMRDFFLANPQIVSTIDFHSFSQYVLYPWAYSGEPTPDDALHATIGDAMVEDLAINGAAYVAGQVYTLLYPASGGSLDWTYGARGAVSYTVELRDTGEFGFILPPEQIIPTCEENLAAALTFADLSTRAALLSLPLGAPEQVDAGVGTDVAVLAIDGLDSVTSVSLRSRVGLGGSFVSAPATGNGAGSYTVSLPAAPCGALVQWYVEATTAQGFVVRLPDDAPSQVNEAVAVEQTSLFSTTFETADGWSVGAPGDTATAPGLWTLVDPIGTIAQPEDDHSPVGTTCFVTGQGSPGGQAGQADVDGGATTLVSPILDASDPEARLSYWLWYSNDLGASPNTDVFVAEVSGDGGATWQVLEQVTQSATQWIYRSFRVADFVAPSTNFRARFVASDTNPGSLVEAAIDDFAITVVACSDGIVGDIDRDGDVDGADLGILLGQWGGPGSADLDGNGTVDGADLGVLLGAWE